MKQILYLILSAAMLASCSNGGGGGADDGTDGGGAAERVPIVFGSSIVAVTRAVADDAVQFSDGDRIGLIGYCADAAGPTIGFSSPFLNKAEFSFAGGKFTSADAGAYWQPGKVHNFYACYPHDLLNGVTLGASAPAVALTVAATTGIVPDVMHARVENTAAFTGTAGSTAQLGFKHALAKVKFRVRKEKATDADRLLSRVEFTMAHANGTFSVATGAVTPDGDTPATLSRSGLNQTVGSADPVDVNASWLVLPGDGISDIRLTVDGSPLAVPLPDEDITTVAGRMTVITLTIKASGIGFASATLEEWGSATGEGELRPTPPAKIGDYYYSDGTYSTKFESGKVCLGIVYRQKTDDAKGMMVSLDETTLQWYQAIPWCNDKNIGEVKGWYLPAKDELLALYRAYDAFGKSIFNDILTVSGTPFDSDYYWSSSSGSDSDFSRYVHFGNGGTSTAHETFYYRVRCVKVF